MPEITTIILDSLEEIKADLKKLLKQTSPIEKVSCPKCSSKKVDEEDHDLRE